MRQFVLSIVRHPLSLAFPLVSSLAISGCIEDSDCGVCDPESLVLESISGLNSSGKKVHLLNPDCQGDKCPGDFDEGRYFIDRIGPCLESEGALDPEIATRGAEEFCKLSPLAPLSGPFGLEFVFNNLLDPTSIELVRKRPDNPQLFEVYDWKSQIVSIQGPITRFNGDYFAGTGKDPDLVTRAVNLSCIDNLRTEGADFSHEENQDPATNPCNALGPNGLPRKLFAAGVVKSYRGEWDWRDRACDSPDDQPDTCCSLCDYELSVNVAKYGVNASGVRRNPNLEPGHPDGAIACDPMTEDALTACADFIPSVDRSKETRRYKYDWNGDGTIFDDCDVGQEGCEVFALPEYDKLRETHPDRRPDHLQRRNAGCTRQSQCEDIKRHNLPGTDCVGEMPDGSACDPNVSGDEGCTNGRCVPEWFVTCRASENTTGAQGYCVDQRFSDAGAPACYRSTAQFEVCDPDDPLDCETASAGTKLAWCAQSQDGRINTLPECCQDGLGGNPGQCDPFFQPQIEPLDRFERNRSLPEETRRCMCQANARFADKPENGEQPSSCKAIVEEVCFDNDGNFMAEKEGEYAVKFISKVGGVIYDPAIKGFEWRAGHAGNVRRAVLEDCAEDRGVIGDRNVQDGWRANDPFPPHYFEDFDRGLCSASSYTIVFNTPQGDDAVEYVEDKAGNTLEGKSEYRFETPEFRIIPGSGFPTNNLRIGACDSFSLNFSNKYDLSPENLAKIELWLLGGDPEGLPQDRVLLEKVAGGPGCARDQSELEGNTGALPCLQVDVRDQVVGKVQVRINPNEFGGVLEPGMTYRMVVPGLASPADMNDPALYQAAFWDVCGMPLVTGGANDFYYDFEIDRPKCNEDEDLDGFPFSCDNAEDVYNPDQADLDSDGLGDVIDLCATVAGPNNEADSDRDGIGNECDSCRQILATYNEYALDLAIDPYMIVRNIPFQHDSDGDGIGDVCDNCITVANCETYDETDPWVVGDPIDFDNNDICQTDTDADMVGEACDADAGNDNQPGPNAVGPIGFEEDDDFDQDGLRNIVDGCPRQPVGEVVLCADPSDCESGTCSADGVCNHRDSDLDGVGDQCDTCPFKDNPMQNQEGGMQEFDYDEDFVGDACETHSSCNDSNDPRPYSFYEVSVNGYCCVASYQGGPGTDPCTMDEECPQGYMCDPGEGVCNFAAPSSMAGVYIPVRFNCTEQQQEAEECKQMPNAVLTLPGVVELPPGCDEALAATPTGENRKLTPADFGGDLGALWDTQCFLPQFDQDFDGLGDACDLCDFAFDPENLPFVDPNGKVWPGDGKFCNGKWDIDEVCKLNEEEETDGTGTGDSGSTGGSGETGGSEETG